MSANKDCCCCLINLSIKGTVAHINLTTKEQEQEQEQEQESEA